MNKFSILILSLFLAGCASTTGTVNEFSYTYLKNNGKPEVKKEIIFQMVLNKEGGMRYKKLPDGTVECEFDSRKPTLWERFVTPIMKGASDKASTEVK